MKQEEITINIFQTSWKNPRLSAYAQLFGAFDFNATPMAPPGTRVIAHNKSKQRATWSKHGAEGCYIGPRLENYISYKNICKWYKTKTYC